MSKNILNILFLTLTVTSVNLPTFVQAEGLEGLFNRSGITEEKPNSTKKTEDSPQDLLQKQIDLRLKSIIEKIGTTNRSPIDGILTIEELDRLRREAERAEATKALREAERQEIQAEIEMLTFLQTTLNELQNSQVDETKSEENKPMDIETLRAQWEAEKIAEQAASTKKEETVKNDEQKYIPRLVSIRGAGGKFEAEIESVKGIIQYVTPGDSLADGFILESIDPKGVVIKGSVSGNRYSLIPSPPLAKEAAQTVIPVARDLGASGF